MTTPLDHGFPDFGRQIAIADQKVVSTGTVVLTAATTYGPFFVGNMPWIFLRALAPNVSTLITLDWSTDGTVAGQGARDIMSTLLSDQVAQSVPVRGAFLTITVELSAYPDTFSMGVVMTSVPGNEISVFDDANVLMASDGDVVLAGGVRTYNVIAVRGGWIHWSALLDGATNYLIRLYCIRFDGATILLDVMGGGNSRGGGMIFAPSNALRLTVVNGDAVNHGFYMSVAYNPYSP